MSFLFWNYLKALNRTRPQLYMPEMPQYSLSIWSTSSLRSLRTRVWGLWFGLGLCKTKTPYDIEDPDRGIRLTVCPSNYYRLRCRSDVCKTMVGQERYIPGMPCYFAIPSVHQYNVMQLTEESSVMVAASYLAGREGEEIYPKADKKA